MAISIRASATAPTALDHYARLVGRVLDAHVVCTSLIDADGWLTVSSFGLPPPNAMLVAFAFLRRTTAPGRSLAIADARADPRVARMPAVCDGTVAAFLGMRLVAPDGCVVGTLSAMAERPRQWSARDLDFMRRARGWILAERGGTSATRGIPEKTATDVAVAFRGGAGWQFTQALAGVLTLLRPALEKESTPSVDQQSSSTEPARE